MKIVVLMSTYNGEKYIRQQIESILNQNTEAEVTIVARDDGSSDETLRILDEYHIKYYTGDNLGPARSFFELIRATKGYDYYAFADQDDYWHEDKLQKSVEAISAEVCPAIVYSNPELVDEDLKGLGRQVYKKAPSTNYETVVAAGNMIGCTMLFNEALAEKVRKRQLPEKIRMHDFYLAAVCASIGGKVIFDNHSYMDYRQHSNNTEGVSVSKKNAVKRSINEIKTKAKISIAEQAAEILEKYDEDIAQDREAWLLKVSGYRDSLGSRISMAISTRIHYASFSRSITIRCALLLGNR